MWISILVNMNTDIKKTVKQCASCLDCQHTQQQEKTILQKLPNLLWETAGTYIFYRWWNTDVNVDYYRKFSIMKRADEPSADDLFRAIKVIFTEFGLPKKTVSDAGTNFMSDWFKQFCRELNIDQAITSSLHHQSNGQVKQT